MRVAVVGSYDWPEFGIHADTIRSVLGGLLPAGELSTLIEGCQPGAQRVAHAWGLSRPAGREIEHLHFAPELARWGGAAVAHSNERLLKEGRPDVIYVFNYPGRLMVETQRLLRVARAAEIPAFVMYFGTRA